MLVLMVSMDIAFIASTFAQNLNSSENMLFLKKCIHFQNSDCETLSRFDTLFRWLWAIGLERDSIINGTDSADNEWKE